MFFIKTIKTLTFLFFLFGVSACDIFVDSYADRQQSKKTPEAVLVKEAGLPYGKVEHLIYKPFKFVTKNGDYAIFTVKAVSGDPTFTYFILNERYVYSNGNKVWYDRKLKVVGNLTSLDTKRR